MVVLPPLRVELLGGFRVLTAGRVSPRPPTARQQQLIAFLVLHARSAPIQRQRIAGSIWPESSDTQALTNLRRELHHLRNTWPRLDALIDGGSGTLAWRGEAAAVVDLVAFEAAADRGLPGDRTALHEAARLYKGDVLPDCSGEWIDADRERLRQRARQVLVRLVDLLEHDRAFGDAIEFGQRLVRLDPLDIKHKGSHPRARPVTVKRYIASVAIAGAAVAGLASVALATPGANVVGTIMARAGFADTVDIKLKLRDEPEVIHVAQAADTVMQQIIIGPGGHTGWHSHPGPAIALVKNGELTLFSSEDPTCTGRSFGAGQAFVDSGQGHVHMARNLTSQNVEVWVTYLDVPPGGSVRIDAADPGNCVF